MGGGIGLTGLSKQVIALDTRCELGRLRSRFRCERDEPILQGYRLYDTPPFCHGALLSVLRRKAGAQLAISVTGPGGDEVIKPDLEKQFCLELHTKRIKTLLHLPNTKLRAWPIFTNVWRAITSVSVWSIS
jgi:hypothetical protein